MNWWERFWGSVRCIALAAIAAALLPFFVQFLIAAIQAAMLEPPSCDDYMARIAQAFGVPCAVYQASVKAWGWFFVLVFAVIVIGLIVMVARCFISLFRPEEEEEEQPSVTISGVRPLVLVKEEAGRGSPRIDLTAYGNPSGGSYRWSLVSGADKVDLEGDVTSQTIGLRPKKADCSKNDIIVKVDYSTSEGSASDQVALTVHKPTAAILVHREKNDFNGVMFQTICGTMYGQGPYYGYEVKTKWQILDQFGDPFPEQVVFLEEDLFVLHNPYNTPFQESDFVSDQFGVYSDCYATIFQGQPVPNNYVAKVRQIVRAEGFEILDQQLIYGPTDIQILTPEPQICP